MKSRRHFFRFFFGFIITFITLKYIFEIIFPNQLINLNNIMIVPGMFDWQDQGLGIIFDLPTALLEYLFKIEDSENYYLFRHITNYLFFLTSLFFFFMIIVKRYQSYLMAFIGTTFLLLSPRIFADSFYNNKDIIFLSFFIINIYTAINF